MEKIKIETTVQASANKAWSYYTEPEHITNWNFASEDWCCPEAKNELRKGGKYFARMEAKDGSFGFDFEAIYDRVEEGKGFSYTMEDGRKVDVDFHPADGNTRVTVVFEPEQSNPIEMQRGGWQSILDNYAKYLNAANL